MEANQARTQNMIDTTDALEAVGACQSMKNFLFTLILIGLALCQTVFWMNYFGLINKDGCTACQGAVQQGCSPDVCSQDVCPKTALQKSDKNARLPFLAATIESTTAESQEGKAIEQAIDEIVGSANQTQPEAEILLEKETDYIPAEIVTETASDEVPEHRMIPEKAETQEEDVTLGKLSMLHISCWFAKGLVTICNFVILSAVMLYCLSLLICLKISLTGRLGGINHIARAFFISLFLLVIVTPWQVVLPKVLIGSIWLPGELLCGYWDKADSSIICTVMFYLRFCGLTFAVLWLLLWAQIRSAKWARATLRRLGVAR